MAGKIFTFATEPNNNLSLPFAADRHPYASTLPLVDPADKRVNYMDRFFFVTRYNQQFNAVGYAVDWTRGTLVDPAGVTNLGKGVLYRFYTNNIGIDQLSNILSAPPGGNLGLYGFNALVNYYQSSGSNDWSTNFGAASANSGIWQGGWQVSRISDGVFHLRVRAYDTNGFLATNGVLFLNGSYIQGPPTNRYTCTNLLVGHYYNTAYTPALDEYTYSFYSNALPAYVGLEVGILESRAGRPFEQPYQQQDPRLRLLYQPRRTDAPLPLAHSHPQR